jgi:hypothetical protein
MHGATIKIKIKIKINKCQDCYIYICCQHYEDILSVLERLCLKKMNLILEGAARNAGYATSIWSTDSAFALSPRKNHGKPWSS